MALTQISTEGIKNGTISTADLADQSVTLAKLPHGTSSNDGKFLRANNGGQPTFETVNTDLSADSSPQLGGNLDVNTKNILFGDSASSSDDRLKFGADADFMIFHDGTNTKLQNDTGELIYMSDTHRLRSHTTAEDHIVSVDGGAVELYHNGTRKFRTTSGGVRTDANLEMLDNHELQFGNNVDLKIFHESSSNDNIIDCATTRPLRIRFGGSNQFEFLSGGGIKMNDGRKIFLGDSSDFQIYHDGSNSRIHDDGTGVLAISGSEILFQNAAQSETIAKFAQDGQCELYHDNSKVVQTHANGITFSHSSGNLIKYGSTSEFPNAAINIERSGNGYANIRLSSNYGCGLYMAGANDNTDEFGINQDNQKIGYLDNRGGAIKITTGSNGLQRIIFENSYTITSLCDFLPSSNNTKDLGSSSLRWANVYTNDLSLSNEGSANDVDGTWGSYTIQEGAEDLFLVNKRNGKKYKFNLTEVS